MDARTKIYNRIAALVVFVAAPILIYTLCDFPRRSALKEVISLLTIAVFFVALLQFYLSRAGQAILSGHKMRKVVQWHKVLGYIVASILLLHPFLIVLPRFFESGIEPQVALLTLITTGGKGLVLGIVAWFTMLLIALTSIFRNNLGISYKFWRVLHGIMAIVFVCAASFHVIDLGRHVNIYMLFLIAILSISAVALLLKKYVFNTSSKN